MGREVYQFIGINKYFEDETFDWVRVSGSLEKSKIELIRSIDEGNEFHFNVTSFSTVAENDIEEVKEFFGNFEQCLSWLESEFGGSPDKGIECVKSLHL